MSEELSLREIRIQKLERMRELGHDPFAQETFERSGSAADLLNRFEGREVENLKLETISFAGRVVSYRDMGKAGFAHLSDGDGKIQVYVRKDEVSNQPRATLTPRPPLPAEQGEGEIDGWELFQLTDIGDHVGVEGYLFLTKTGERSIHVSRFVPLSKSLQTLPLGKTREVKDDAGNVVGQETWYGLEDVEQRYRHRHLDLIANPEARKMLLDRAKIVSAVRRYFDSQGYLEVETPLLQVVAGGAAARPFTTHYNAYEMDVKLRISLELYLKRLICGDIPAVYEIGRVFRNEGVSNRHNPEFSLLEFYEAYTNLEGMMRRVEECFAFVAMEVYGTTTIATQPTVRGIEQIDASDESGTEAPSDNVEVAGEIRPGWNVIVDFSKPWKRVDLMSEIAVRTGIDKADLYDLETAKAAIQKNGVIDKSHALGGHIDLAKENNLGGLIEKLLEVFVEPMLIEPTFVVGYPIEVSPLAKKDPSNPRMTRRFEGYINGREICNAFSEINDPIDQKERFEQQGLELAGGDEEAHPYDEEFLYALEGGMPPTGGCGIGMERLAMVFTGAEHIREVLFFPMMKPTTAESEN